MELLRCSACGSLEGRFTSDDEYCERCVRRFPVTLLTAATADGKYALGLRTGVEVRFSSASIDVSDWVRVFVTASYGATEADVTFGKLPHEGAEVDIALSEIVWCCEL